jgi:hypothetical protein
MVEDFAKKLLTSGREGASWMPPARDPSRRNKRATKPDQKLIAGQPTHPARTPALLYSSAQPVTRVETNHSQSCFMVKHNRAPLRRRVATASLTFMRSFDCECLATGVWSVAARSLH